MQDALTVDVTSPTAAWLHFLFCTSYHCFYRWSTATIKKKKCVNNCLWLFFKGKCLRPKPRSPPRSLALLNLQASLEVCLAGFAAEWRVRGCTESCFFHCISAVGDCLYKTHLSHLCDSIHPCKLPAPIHPVSVSIWGKRTVCKRKKRERRKEKKSLHTRMRSRGSNVQTYVKTKNKVVDPTRSVAAVDTGMYLVGLNLFPTLLGIL